MPHKHRRLGEADKESFDLPPSALAQPLPVNTAQASVFAKKANTKRQRTKDATDDTPKQFARLMRWTSEGVKLPRGLDDGNDKRPSKKRKRGTDDNNAVPKEKEMQKSTAPQILPGERLSDFAARVDQALPLSSLASLNSRKDGKPIDPALRNAVKERPTKHNKRLLRMQKEWREEEARRKAKREEKADEDEEKREEDGVLWAGVKPPSKKKKVGNSTVTGLEGSDDDPWAELTKQKREATKQKNLQDVVQAPPQLDHRKAIGKGRIFRDVVVDVENVPAAVGSLRKREELASKRREVIEQYRQKRGGKWENRTFEDESD